LLQSIFIILPDSFLPKPEVAVVKTVFYKYDTYIQDKTDCDSAVGVVGRLWTG
jgi:hypothetical protein